MMQRIGKKRLIGALLLGLLLAAGAAWAALTDADIVFLTVDDSYTAGALGTIEVGNPPTKNLVTGLAGDEMGVVVDIWGQKKILLRRYHFGSTSDTVRLYPGESWSPIAESKLGDNICQVKVVGDALYVANWGDTGSRRGSIEQYDVQDLLDSAASMTPARKVTFDDGDDFFEHVKDFRVVGNYLYAIVADVKGSWPPVYDKSRLYKVSLSDMTVADSLEVAKNPGGSVNKAVLAEHGSALYVACFGGAYGEVLTSSLVKVDLATFKATVLDGGSALPAGYGYSGIAVAPDGSVLINAASTNWEEPTKLFRSTVADLEASTPKLTALDVSDVGFGGTLFFDAATDRFWVEGSKVIVAVGRDGAVLRTYTATDLGGNPYDVLSAAGLSFSGEVLPPGGGSGGCALGFAPAGLLLVLPLLILVGRR